jgi:hypothetical protein
LLLLLALVSILKENAYLMGRLVCGPLLERVAAKRTSKNRKKGTIEMNVVPVNKIRYRKFMIQKDVHAIKEKWPDRNQNMLIQQDGASSHIDADDPEFDAVGITGVWNIRLMTQSPKLEQRICRDNG